MLREGVYLGSAPIAQSVGVLDGKYGGVHSYVVPDTVAAEPFTEVPGDEVNLSAPAIDKCGWKTLSQLVIDGIFVSLVISVFTCVYGRADFTLPFLLFGYYVWCYHAHYTESEKYTSFVKSGKEISSLYEDTKSLRPANASTVKVIKTYTLLLGAVTLIDCMWILLAFKSWTCVFEGERPEYYDLDRQTVQVSPPTWCMDPTRHQALIATYRTHKICLILSTVGAMVKACAVAVSFLWERQQKRATKKYYDDDDDGIDQPPNLP